jgi:hypothetical protein
MSIATLLDYTDAATFDFEHMMAHRNYFAVMAPLNRFSVLPYLLDPSYDTGIPASKWHLNHQQAHNDSLNVLPSLYGSTTIGLHIGGNLIDWDLSSPDQLQWWTFANHHEHYIANASTLPLLESLFPFW